MIAELIPIKFNKIMQTRSYTVVLLGTDEKKFAIYTDPQIGKLLQMYLTGSERPRPYTHDLMNSIFKGLNIRLKQIVINDIQDTVYFARLFIEQQKGDELNIVEIDARPSDCITLALMNNIPVYCTKEVFEKAAPIEEV
jgi:bifunctional DNase/RNase